MDCNVFIKNITKSSIISNWNQMIEDQWNLVNKF
jgi:hypothetical protein